MVIIKTESNTLSVKEEIKNQFNVGSKETENKGNGNRNVDTWFWGIFL